MKLSITIAKEAGEKAPILRAVIRKYTKASK